MKISIVSSIFEIISNQCKYNNIYLSVNYNQKSLDHFNVQKQSTLQSRNVQLFHDSIKRNTKNNVQTRLKGNP